MRIVFTGGGTGGHLYPVIAVARELKRIAEEERILDLELYYFGPEAIPRDVAEAEGLLAGRISAGKLRRYFSWENFLDAFKIALGIAEALWNMFFVMPDVVFSKGGFGSFPVTLAARIYRIPVMVHASDAVPGRVERWAGTWARRIAISFPNAAKYFPERRTAVVGVPVRSRIVGGNRDAAREALGVFSDRPVLFTTGGSQGAAIINQTIIQILKELLERYELIHQAGPKNIEDVRLEAMALTENGPSRDGHARPGGVLKPYYHLFSFLDENQMRSAYALADLVISRAGATNIFELAAVGKPAILIPIKISAQNHQRENAYAYAKSGAAVVVEEDNLTGSVLLHEINTLVADPERRAKMGEAAKAFARPEAATTIAKELLTLGLH